jgi:hypothetical protein
VPSARWISMSESGLMKRRLDGPPVRDNHEVGPQSRCALVPCITCAESDHLALSGYIR